MTERQLYGTPIVECIIFDGKDILTVSNSDVNRTEWDG